MNDPIEYGRIFQDPHRPDTEELSPPSVDGSEEAMRRLRHPFDAPPQASDRSDRPDRT